MANLALNQGIGKILDMPGGFPGFWVHYNWGVYQDNIVPALHESFQPFIFDVIFQKRAQGPVIPKRLYSSVNFGRLKNKTAPLAQTYDFVHSIFNCLRINFE